MDIDISLPEVSVTKVASRGSVASSSSVQNHNVKKPDKSTVAASPKQQHRQSRTTNEPASSQGAYSNAVTLEKKSSPDSNVTLQPAQLPPKLDKVQLDKQDYLDSMDFDEKLIQEVRRHNSLYDVSSFEYKDPTKKEKSWSSVSEATGVPVHDCQVRWKSIRDKYVRQKKAESQGGVEVSDRWRLTPKLAFLDKCIKHRRVYSKTYNQQKFVTMSNDESAEKDLLNSDGESRTGEENNKPDNFIVVFPDNVTMRPVPIAPKPIAIADGRSGSSSLLKTPKLTNKKQVQALHIKEQPPSPPTPRPIEMPVLPLEIKPVMPQTPVTTKPGSRKRPATSSDADHLFGLSVGSSLKYLSSQKKALAKLRIQQVLYEVQFGPMYNSDPSCAYPTPASSSTTLGHTGLPCYTSYSPSAGSCSPESVETTNSHSSLEQEQA